MTIQEKWKHRSKRDTSKGDKQTTKEGTHRCMILENSTCDFQEENLVPKGHGLGGSLGCFD